MQFPIMDNLPDCEWLHLFSDLCCHWTWLV